MRDRHLFKAVELNEVFKQRVKPLLAVLSPNYEERSINLSNHIRELTTVDSVVDYFILCFQNNKDNDSLLEGLKRTNIDVLCNNLSIHANQINWLQYPNGFAVNVLKTMFIERMRKYNSEFDILIDVSTIPRPMIFSICETLQYFIDSHEYKIEKIYFVYSTPEKYSNIHYAQDIGLLYGFFSGKSLRTNSFDEIHSIVFPSRTGHEGKLLLDDLHQIHCGEQLHTIYFPIDKAEYIRSLELMRANQTLLNQDEYVQRYYCSFADVAIDLHKLFLDEVNKIKTQREKLQCEKLNPCLYLVAPFGAKIFLPITYFELIEMKRELKNLIEIEICHAKGFQYTSVYSQGVGKLYSFEMDVVYD